MGGELGWYYWYSPEGLGFYPHLWTFGLFCPKIAFESSLGNINCA